MRIIAFFLLALLLLNFIACKKSTCELMKCSAGDCIEGVCRCADGYEGSACNQLIRAKFIGYFYGREASCTASNPGAYTIRIWGDTSDLKKVYIENIWKAYGTCTGTLREDGNVYIAKQTDTRGHIVEGAASITNGKLRLGFSITSASIIDPDNCVWKED